MVEQRIDEVKVYVRSQVDEVDLKLVFEQEENKVVDILDISSVNQRRVKQEGIVTKQNLIVSETVDIKEDERKGDHILISQNIRVGRILKDVRKEGKRGELFHSGEGRKGVRNFQVNYRVDQNTFQANQADQGLKGD